MPHDPVPTTCIAVAKLSVYCLHEFAEVDLLPQTTLWLWLSSALHEPWPMSIPHKSSCHDAWCAGPVKYIVNKANECAACRYGVPASDQTHLTRMTTTQQSMHKLAVQCGAIAQYSLQRQIHRTHQAQQSATGFRSSSVPCRMSSCNVCSLKIGALGCTCNSGGTFISQDTTAGSLLVVL